TRGLPGSAPRRKESAMLDERRNRTDGDTPPSSTLGERPEPPLQARDLLRALQSVRDGDFSVRLPGDWAGTNGKLADTFNALVAWNAALASELKSVGQGVGKRGETRQRVFCENHKGAWGGMETSVNTLIEDLLWPTSDVTRTIAAVAKGDLTQTMGLEVD